MSPEEWSARTSVTEKPPRSVVPPVFIGLRFLQSLCDQPHAQIVIRGDRRAGAFRNVERIADVVAMTMGEQDMVDGFDRRRLVRGESRIAGEEGIDQDSLAVEVQAEGGMSVPGDLHGGFLWRHPLENGAENSCNDGGINRVDWFDDRVMIGHAHACTHRSPDRSRGALARARRR